MLLRIRSADELSPRIVVHLTLALILAPLLLVKVIVVRYQKSAWNVLITLGVTIFALAFTLVSMNVAVHYVRDLTPHKVPFAISLRVIAVVVVSAVVALLARVENGGNVTRIVRSTWNGRSGEPRFDRCSRAHCLNPLAPNSPGLTTFQTSRVVIAAM
jgi:amino acid transporter